MTAPPLPPVPPLTPAGFTDPVWARWLNQLRASVIQVASSVAIATANGFNGTVSASGGIATITLGTTVNGIIKGVGGTLAAAAPGTDYLVHNETITLSGDVTGSGSTAIATTLAASGVTAGTYGSATVTPQFSVDAKGRVTGVTNVTITANSPQGGTTALRPVSPPLYQNYFDTTLGQPIWARSIGPAVWVNSAGVVV